MTTSARSTIPRPDVTDHDAGAPRYRSIRDDLLDRIARGVYAPGSKLPSEAQLCREYGASRITIRHALDGVAERRLIRRSQGAGTVVCEPEELVKSAFVTGYIDDVIPLNRHRVTSEVVAVPPESIRLALRMAPGTPTRCIRSVNHVDELPLSYTDFWFAPDCANAITAADFYGGLPPIRVVEKRTARAVARAEQVVDPIVADAEIAERLLVAPGTPVLQALRTYYDAADRPMESIVVRYHPERYRFRVTLVPKIVPVRRPATHGAAVAHGVPPDGAAGSGGRRRTST